ncbi:MAG: hypothetical protein IPK15_20350 [Verrucomicrobia bacterium]|nr:hypothetical protein [Verrucomicrobiota bacterium]
MKLEDLVTRAEIETRRSPQDFVNWFEGLLSRIQSHQDELLKHQVLTHGGIAKQIYEEVFPLYRLLQEKGSQWASVRVRNVLGNQAGDVEVAEASPHIPSKLEITYVVNGKDHMLRMAHLAEHGWVSMSGRLESQKERGMRTMRVEAEFREVGEVVNEVIERLRERIKDKLTKHYGLGTGLIVYVEDDGTLQHSDAHWRRVIAATQEFLPQLKQLFLAAYLVLASNGKVIELDLM